LQGARAGVGRYVFELCRALDVLLPEARFFVYSHIPVDMPVYSPRWLLRDAPQAFIPSRRLRSFLGLKTWVGMQCRSDRIDAFWGCASFLPQLSDNVRKVLTVYDLNYKLVPETMLTPAVWLYRLFFKSDVMQADYVLAISKGTSIRLTDFVHRSADAIIYPAVAPDFTPSSITDIQKCLNRYGITIPYLLAVATWEPRKNLELLLNTFLQMKESGELAKHRLILVGGRGWKDVRLAKLVGAAKHVLPLGYVPDTDLPLLYAGADAFVFPSIYEGFGIPVLEARACGATVVTTDIPELREAGGPNAIYIEPTAEGIRQGLRLALQADRRSNTAVRLPTWEEGAQTLAAALRGTL
jgi:glycosyltransferase involved in cell wall biosynthesis